MNDLNLPWLLPMLFQVLSVSLALSVFGFTYHATLRERKPFARVLVNAALLKWLAAAALIFALATGFTHAEWLIKGLAVFLALGCLLLVWMQGRTGTSYRAQVIRQKTDPKAIAWMIGKSLLGVLVLIVLAWGVNLGWHTFHLYSLARGIQNDPNQLNMADVIPLVQNAAGDVDAIHRNLAPLFPLFNALRGLPTIGVYLGQAQPLLTYANALSQAGDEMLTAMQPLLSPASDGLSLPERASQVVASGQEHFSLAAGYIDQAQDARDKILTDLLPDQVRPLFTQLDERFYLLTAGVQLLQAAPTILGSSQPQNYLVLAQNRDELRATGGFISGIGLVTIEDGKILSFTLGDSYAIDDFSKPYPAPPEVLKRFMLADYWVTRDANWSPDFPTAAQQAQSLYTLSTGVETQGVIAFNQLALQKLLDTLGPVQVPGTAEPITAQNVENYMRQAWAPAPEEGMSQEWWLHRKDFMQQLGGVILEKVLASGSQDQLLNLAKMMLDLLDQGQLLVYFSDGVAQSALSRAGWDGALRPGAGDYLYLVDSNVGFNKMDTVVKRSLAYHVDLTDIDQPVGEVTLDYQNTATGAVPCVQEASYGTGTYQDMQKRCYWDYWRIYAPTGSKLLSSTAQPVAAEELLNHSGWSGEVENFVGESGTQVFAGLFVLPPSKSSQLDLVYRLPASTLRPFSAGQHVYSLRIDVQPGLQGLPIKLEVTLPSTLRVSYASDGMKSDGAGSWVWQGILQGSLELSLTLSPIN